jgi:phage tail protein X
VVSWGNLAGTGSVTVAIDLHNGGLACGTRTFTNTVVITLPDGTKTTATAVTTINFVSGGGFVCK